MNNPYHHTSNLQHNNVTQQLQQTPSSALQAGATASYGYIQQSPPQLLHQLSQQLQHQPPHHHHHQLLPTNAILSNGGVPTTASAALYGLNKSDFYTTASASDAASTPQPNTILITNNFSQQQQSPRPKQQQQQQTHGVYKGSNIRIISTPNFFSINRANNTSNIDDGQHHHIYDAQASAVATQHHLPELMSTTYAPQHFSTSTFHPYYVPTTIATAEGLTVNASASAVASNTVNSTAVAVNNANVLPQANAVPPMEIANTMMSSNTNAMTSNPSNNNQGTICVTSQNNRSGGNRNKKQTLVLDRINICINNHYSESGPNAKQPVSPIIPVIQHNPIIDSSPLGMGNGTGNLRRPSNFIDRSFGSAAISSSNMAMNSSTIIVIDEPDSTTTPTPHTPPLTPDISTSSSKSSCSTAQSPSSTTNNTQTSPPTPSTQQTFKIKSINKNTFATIAQTIEDVDIEVDEVVDLDTITPTSPQTDSSGTSEQSFIEETIEELLSTPTPPPPIVITPIVSLPKFLMGDDVFVKGQEDGRLYLGTVIECSKDNKYIVSFGDKSEQWCTAEEMRKLGGDQETASDKSLKNPMCIACKITQFADIVEICERCGRGYHRSCTTETLIGSGVWQCKRCAKPMKLVEPQALITRGKPAGICRQFPYDVDKLNWDGKHRVNAEQMYCYCGSSGKFDHDMLQCCKCSNWFHTECLQQFKSELLRGDSFFIFCCTVCNDGVEFVRRLQIEWADAVHLTLYNLRKRQNQKYHHLIKDIWPFILENRHLLPICREWRELPETALMERIKETLKDHKERFINGREVKRENSYYGLRWGGPPIKPFIEITEANCYLTDELLINKYKLDLLIDAPEYDSSSIEKSKSVKRKLSTSADDIYEFRIDDDGTSDEDNLPIKRIMDSVKKRNQLPRVIDTKRAKLNNIDSILDVADDNAYDASCQLTMTTVIASSTTNNIQKLKAKGDGILEINNDPKRANNEQQKSSRKRKAFRVLKSSYENSRLCDLSSDDNSSSSRGTSLNNIIPPPANFLGRNNPFLMISPKKNGNAVVIGGGGIENSICNAKTLDFSSNLKSAGIIFPNLSTSNLAKAAGQPKAVRATKKRLSAKDITIGPNQEVRRKRAKKTNTRVEIISTTAINSVLPSNYFPIHAKDYNAMINRKLHRSKPLTIISTKPSTTTSPSTSTSTTANVSSTSSSMDSLHIEGGLTSTSTNIRARRQTLDVPQQHQQQQGQKTQKPAHGRLLRQRPQKKSSCIAMSSNSRRSSTSSNQSLSTSTSISNNNNHTSSATNGSSNDSDNLTTTIQNLKQTVNKYFGGAINRIEAGESYSIRAKRRLPNGQLQYLIEWGEPMVVAAAAAMATPLPPTATKATTSNGGKDINK